jgi:thiol-disulfide isomerase/thioredoxin
MELEHMVKEFLSKSPFGSELSEEKVPPQGPDSNADEIVPELTVEENTFVNTLTAEVEKTDYILVVKTVSSCPYCKLLHEHIAEFKSIFPSNVKVEYLILDTLLNSDKRVHFMLSKGLQQVPCMYITTSKTWADYIDGRVTDKELSSDTVISQFGMPVPFVYKNIRQWVNNAMYRLYLYESSISMSDADKMILADMDFALIFLWQKNMY